MNKFTIITDSCSDIPFETFKNNELIDYVSMSFEIEGKVYLDNFGQHMPFPEFYNRISHGILPKTAQVTPQSFYETFKKYAKDNIPMLFIGCSSSMGGTFNSSYIARDMIVSDYPNAKIELFDTLSSSLGEGLFVLKAIELRNEGNSLTSVLNELQRKINYQKAYFIVKDLDHLKLGGRLSLIQAKVGKVLKINPILFVDDEGRLNLFEKTRGKNRSMNRLFEIVKDNAQPGETIALSHSNCIEDVTTLKNKIEKEFNIQNIMVTNIGGIVGSHVGVGTIAVFFTNKTI